MEPTFRVGDLAVYPAHGVAQIVGIETREISANKQTFYILKILENGMKIMIPTKNAAGLRVTGRMVNDPERGGRRPARAHPR